MSKMSENPCLSKKIIKTLSEGDYDQEAES